MDIHQLIERAAQEQRSQRALASRLQVHPNVITYWKSGKHRPGPGEIAQLAECAGLPVLETVAEIEAEFDGKHRDVWRRALQALQRGGVAAALALLAYFVPTPRNAEAKGFDSSVLCLGITAIPARKRPGMQICAGLARLARWLLQATTCAKNPTFSMG